ncbi:MAG: DUF4262 domain-containing protein [Bacteroidota bacterium]|nr:DUF4262 domain-containing protein [Bacteroidota bacterium]
MDDPYNHIKKQIISDIQEHGVHIAYVDTDGYTPRFGYSIGLYKEFNHPELIIIGLPPESIGVIINEVKSEIEKGTIYIEDVRYTGFLCGYPIQFVRVSPSYYQDYVGFAGWYNDSSFDFPLLQVVWPDKEHHFPWDDDFNPRLKFQQPLLDRNEDFKFLEERNLGVYTTSDVLEGALIRFVYHNADGDWQFHSGNKPNLEQARLVCLNELVKLDPSLNEIYYLNYGEWAERSTAGSEWKVYAAE